MFLSQMELLIDSVLVLIGGVIGLWHAGRITDRVPGVSLMNVHRYMRGALWVMAVVLTGVVVLSVAGIIRPVAWAMPLVLELFFPFLKWGGLSVVFAYLASLCVRVAWYSGHRERGKLTFATTLLVVALLILRWNVTFSIPADSYEHEVVDGGIILQTTGASCVPATVANILGRFGVTETEKALAREMGTTGQGTTHGRVALALWQRGFDCRRVTVVSIQEVNPPAALTVDHPATGPESHMVGFMGMDGEMAEIWDPLYGRDMMYPEQLSTVWHGKALEVFRP